MTPPPTLVLVSAFWRSPQARMILWPHRRWGRPVVGMIPPPGSHDGYEVGGTAQCRREQCVRLVKGFAPALPPRQGRGGNQVVG